MTNYSEQRAERLETRHRRARGMVARLVAVVLVGMLWIWAGLPGTVYWWLVVGFYIGYWTVTLYTRNRHMFSSGRVRASRRPGSHRADNSKPSGLEGIMKDS